MKLSFVMNPFKTLSSWLDDAPPPPKKWITLSLLGLSIAMTLFYCDRDVSLFFAEHSSKHLRLVCRFISLLMAPLVHLLLWPALFIGLSLKQKKIHKKSLRITIHLLFLNTLATISKVALGRPRPKYLYSGGSIEWQFINFNENFHSFPSRHSATIMIIALCFAAQFPKKRFYFIAIASMFALARVPINSHYLSDIIGGILTALLSFLIMERLLNNLRSYAADKPPI